MQRRHSSAGTPNTPPRPVSTSFARPSTRGLTTAAMCTSTTPAVVSTRQSSCASTAAARDGRLRQSALGQPHLGRQHRARRAGPCLGAQVLQRLARGVRRDLHPQRHRRAEARRRGLPVPRRRPVPAHLRQPQLRQRHPRVRPRARRRDHLCADRPARPARRRGAAAALPDRHRAAITTTCSPTLRSRTSPACSTRWNGSRRRKRTAGTCCSTPPHSCPPTGWT